MLDKLKILVEKINRLTEDVEAITNMYPIDVIKSNKDSKEKEDE